MIAFLQGILTAKHPDRVELDVNGIGYEVFVSQKTLQAVPATGKSVLLKTYLHVREDIQQLFGFLKDSEKQAFFQAILHNDLAGLKSIPGIGQKTAQHLVLELKDKVTKLAGGGVFSDEGALGSESKVISDALQAMMTLGYSAVESRRAVLSAAQTLGCLLYTSPSPRDRQKSRMPSS